MVDRKLIDTWKNLKVSGNNEGARDFYDEYIFPRVVDEFEKDQLNTALQGSFDILFSMLGKTPEPIILTQRCLKAAKHIIFYNDASQYFDTDISPYLSEYLKNYELIELNSKSITCIHQTLREQLSLNACKNCAIDITGGKKSMVAAASIFARDYDCTLLYVNFDDNEYDPYIRRPLPGSEYLDVVYNPNIDLL